MPRVFNGRAAEILLVEDNPGDALLTLEAFRGAKVRNNLHHVTDGVQAMSFLRRHGEYADAPRPDVMFLDLNMPRKDGRELLCELKQDPDLKSLPVVVLTTSSAEQDILRSYHLQASCYVTKPVEFDQFEKIVRELAHCWFTIVALPTH